MASLWRYLRQRRKDRFRTLDAFGEAMRAAGCQRPPKKDSFCKWFTGAERIPKDELPRVLGVLDLGMRDATPHMDRDDVASYAEQILADDETGERFMRFLRAPGAEEVGEVLAEARRRTARGERP